MEQQSKSRLLLESPWCVLSYAMQEPLPHTWVCVEVKSVVFARFGRGYAMSFGKFRHSGQIGDNLGTIVRNTCLCAKKALFAIPASLLSGSKKCVRIDQARTIWLLALEGNDIYCYDILNIYGDNGMFHLTAKLCFPIEVWCFGWHEVVSFITNLAEKLCGISHCLCLLYYFIWFVHVVCYFT